MRAYLLNIVYTFDLLINAICGGERYQTISARWGKSRTKVWLFYWGCQMLDRLQLKHCETAAENYARIQAALMKGK